MKTLSAKEINRIKQLYGTSDTSEIIRLILKETNLAKVSKFINPVISEIFNIPEKDLKTSSKHKIIQARRLLYYILENYFKITTDDISTYFNTSKRTVLRSVRIVRTLIFKPKDTLDYKIYSEYIIKSHKVINFIKENYYDNKR